MAQVMSEGYPSCRTASRTRCDDRNPGRLLACIPDRNVLVRYLQIQLLILGDVGIAFVLVVDSRRGRRLQTKAAGQSAGATTEGMNRILTANGWTDVHGDRIKMHRREPHTVRQALEDEQGVSVMVACVIQRIA